MEGLNKNVVKYLMKKLNREFSESDMKRKLKWLDMNIGVLLGNYKVNYL